MFQRRTDGIRQQILPKSIRIWDGTGQQTLARPARLKKILSTLADQFSHDLPTLLGSGALEGRFADFVQLSGKNLEARTRRYDEWRSNRLKHGVWPISTELQSGPGPDATVIDEAGKPRTGVTVAPQRHL